MLKKDIAICLRTVNYSETSQIVTVFTREFGKVPAIAKGSKRPKSKFDGPIEILSFGNIVFANADSGKLASLTEFQQRPKFLQLRKNLFALNCALFATELMDKFTHDHDPHPGLLDVFLQFLDDTQNADSNPENLALLILFQLSILNEIGSMPILNRCTNCNVVFSNNWPYAYFSSSATGVVCVDCEQTFTEKIRLTKNSAKCLADIKLIRNADVKTLDEIEKVLIYHFTELMHKPPKMAKYFLKK